MRVITHCPACQTQFFATEEQLNKHAGKVRCGQCLQVFDARAQFITVAENNHATSESTGTKHDISNIDNAAAAQAFVNQPFIISPTETAGADSLENTNNQQPSYLGDAFKKNRSRTSTADHQSRRWFWGAASMLLFLIAGIQSMYFLRNEIAIYFPDTKPYLLQACQKLACSISPPKNIESIMIDDSDMQEDADHAGLIRFASTLINSGNHALAYPNLELTLTNIEDNPVLRRVFKPNEYLPAGINAADGLQAREEVRIKLAIMTGDTTISGYRVFVTY